MIRPYGTGLGLGLLFIAFGRSLTTQVEFVRRAWINNKDFPTVGAGQDELLFGGAVNTRALVGAYYFAPPLAKASDATSWVIPTPES
jgi:deferrochelatase/peroxidase EfeB